MSNSLPLETWRRLMGMNPWHFFGLQSNTGAARVTSGCNDIVSQSAWQDTQAVGRDEIAQAIEDAETKLAEWLGFRVAPQYAESLVAWEDTGTYWRWPSVQLREGHIRAIGVEAKTLIGTPAVSYSDRDGDTIDDTFTLSVATTVTDPDEIAVYIAASDRLDGEGATERWRVQPVAVSISGGTATIRGRAWLLVRPVLYEGVDTDGLEAATATNFVSSLEVYRRYTDPNGETIATAQAVLEWETHPAHGWWCCCVGCNTTLSPASSSQDPAAVAKAIARAGIRNGELGIVAPFSAVRNAVSGIWSDVPTGLGIPDRITVRYLAGLPLENGQMARRWQTVVARLAAAELGRPVCSCDAANRELHRWQFDVSRAAGANDEQYAVAADDLTNPFGTRRGHIEAWKWVRQTRQMRGFLLG